MRMMSAPIVAASAALALFPTLARADHQMAQGRTGLPTVRQGGEKVWMQQGRVVLDVRGDTLRTTQRYRLKYPGRPLEKGPSTIVMAVREDFYRSLDNDTPKVTPSDARGFEQFGVYVDGRRVASAPTEWKVNDKGDTATRWREWPVRFRPNQIHNVEIVSLAPLSRNGDRRVVEFVNKDLGHWRQSPDSLEIRLTAPGATETQLAGLEPKPNDVNSRAVRWVYRKASPNRDIMVMLPRRGRYSPSTQ